MDCKAKYLGYDRGCKRQGKSGTIDIKAVLAEDEEFLRALVRMALQEVLEAEMTEALGAKKGERASRVSAASMLGSFAQAKPRGLMRQPPKRSAALRSYRHG